MKFTEEQLAAYQKRHQQSDKSKPKRAAGGSKPKNKLTSLISCHAVALIRLAKCPALRTGGVIRGKRVQANYEHWDQVTIFDYFERTNPEVYDHLAAIPNGGKRSKKTANEMQAEGAKTGYPDMGLDIPRGRYHGMKLELKKEGGNKPSNSQIEWLNRLDKQGYFVCLAYGSEAAIKAVEAYIKLSGDESMPMLESEKKWKQKRD